VPVPPSPAKPNQPPSQRKRSDKKAAKQAVDDQPNQPPRERKRKRSEKTAASQAVDDEMAEVRATKRAKQQTNRTRRNGAEEARRLLDAESD